MAEHLRKPDEWAPEFDRIVIDPDGWREESRYGAKRWDEPITREEYEQRMAESTTAPRDS